jgi:hypothetical protein
MKQLVNNLTEVKFTTIDGLDLCNILAAECEDKKYVFSVNKYGNIALVNGSSGWNTWSNGSNTIRGLLQDSRVKIFVFDSLDELADWIKS